MTAPVVAAIDMGYGHLRAAAPLAEHFGVPLHEMDRPPLGDAHDHKFWERTRTLYEPLTRISQLPWVGGPMRALLEAVTAIPEPWPVRDLSGATQGTRWMERAAKDGAGRALAQHLRETGAPLLTTFYAAAILAELHGAERLYCVVTDTDINRVWAPPRPRQSRIVYLAPSERARRRLESYGVPAERVRTTGFPLPHALVGGRGREALKANLAARLSRLDTRGVFRARWGDELARHLGALPDDRRAPLVTFAVGGAGAQLPLAAALVRGARAAVEGGKLRLSLVAGRRAEVAQGLREAVRDAGLEAHAGVQVLFDPDVHAYLRKFNVLLAGTDVLWSKPSEITFYAALGLPLVCAPPVGVHESWNQRWAQDAGAALAQHDPATAADWLQEWLEDGTLAGAAWAGFHNLPALGLYEIADELGQAAE